MPRVSRVVVLGSSTVGKSALIAALLGQTVDTAEYDPTTEPCCTQEFEVVDTPGKAAFAADAPAALRAACRDEPIDGALVCFAVNDAQSFTEAETRWAPVAAALGVPTVLCGTKLDLQDGPKAADSSHNTANSDNDDTFLQDRESGAQVTPAQGAALAERVGAAGYVECSAATRIGVQAAVHAAVRAAVLHASAQEQAVQRAAAAAAAADAAAREAQAAARRAEAEHFQALGVPTAVFIGPTASGKTALINALLGGEWSSEYVPTGPGVAVRPMRVAAAHYDTVRLVEVPAGAADAHGLLARTARECPNCVCAVCVPVVDVRAFARECRVLVRRVREADAPAPVVVLGTKVDLVECAPDCADTPLFAGVARTAAERIAHACGAAAYIECSAVSLFGVPNARTEVLRHALAPRTAGQNVRGVLRSAGMLLGWVARTLVASATHDSDDEADAARARANARRHPENDGYNDDDDVSDTSGGGVKTGDGVEEDEEEEEGKEDVLEEQEVDAECRFEVFVCGAAGAGKTALVRRYLRQPFVAAAPGRALGTLRFALRGRPYAPRRHEVVLWDCATLMPAFPANHGRCAVVFAVDATRRDAPRAARALLAEMEAQYGTLYCSRVLAITHTDEESACVLSDEQVERLADDLGCARVVRTAGAASDATPLARSPIHVAVQQLLVRNSYG